MERINGSTKANASGCTNLHESRFKILLFIFRQGGLPVKLKSVSKIYTVYSATIILCFYITTLCLFMDTLVHRRQLDYTMKKLRVFLTFAFIVWIHITFSYRKSDFEQLLSLTDSFTWEELPTRDPDTGYLTKAGYIPIIQAFTKYIYVFLIAFNTTQSVVRSVMSHDMFFASWYPFDVSASPMYEIANFSQGIAVLFVAGVNFGFTNLYTTLVCVACTQLEKLKLALLDIRQTHVTSEQKCGDEIQQSDFHEQPRPSDESFRHMQEQLNNCIRHHQQINRYLDTLEDTTNLTLCGALLMLSMIMCVDAFSTVTGWGDHTDLSQAVMMYIFAVASVCIFCWMSSELSEQVENVRDAAWGCDWVGTPVSFQRCLVFIITTANKGFTLTAGKFFPVSNTTMMNIIKESISLFMFLLHMKDKHTI